MHEELKKLISDIKNIKATSQFGDYINSIRFPFYKNLESNTRIDFDFPLTIFVGQNGSGKTSVLQALYGAPEGYSPGEFWFSTKVDAIEKSVDGNKPSLIYSWQSDTKGNPLEVLKTRVGFKKGMDYWEPSRPIIKYGMKTKKGGRNPTIKKKVIHLDFRSILSSFDKYFYFEKPNNLKAVKTKQDYLRKKSVHLRNIIDKTQIQKDSQGEPVNDLPRSIPNDEIAAISEILGKQYKNGTYIKHKLFSKWGFSILFETDNMKYSEAFAGSGETSATILVEKVMNAPERSLILLDEPEVSLHPGAQKKLTQFLLNEIKKKKHQVIISTHSPGIVDTLPNKAIKVFSALPDGHIKIIDESSPNEAFYFIGQDNTGKITINVEDKLAKAVIDQILSKQSSAFASLFEVKYWHGGDSTLKKILLQHSITNKKSEYCIFDGDQKISAPFNPDEELTPSNRTHDYLDTKIQEITNITERELFKISDFNNDSELRLETKVKFLNFWNRHVDFFPKDDPETMIWDDDFAKNILNTDNLPNTISDEVDFKKKFAALSTECSSTSTSEEIFYLQNLFIKKFCDTKSGDYKTILAVLKEFKKRHEDQEDN
jgi:predicted ATPase